ncbi:TadE-like protein [Paucidesulfovibrio gracilis DSM 16080]|uniref:TadE-like protein n=1 Tax=Paucidesulfovibrio gracilis DSM 16080 TaxID=1121449 RepID=A0A1T4XLU6_9BACT|nr:TadE/TadG family type IV pilus assembly protein [Paucidesulfovibrio gracilis]SKA90542.1 TadE-like protein [Paucidesulfovibrio gracilis DSM 16080]
MNSTRRHTTGPQHDGRQGMVTLEVAVMLCVFLLPFIFGVVDAARFVSAGGAVSRAAREAAVWAARGRDAESVALASLRASGLDQARAQVVLLSNGSESGDQVRVQVLYDLAGYSALPWESVFPSMARAEVVVRHE